MLPEHCPYVSGMLSTCHRNRFPHATGIRIGRIDGNKVYSGAVGVNVVGRVEDGPSGAAALLLLL